MSIIENRLSTEVVKGEFLSPDNRVRPNLTTDYELGGVDIQDSSQGLQKKVWIAQLVGNGVEVSPEDGSSAAQVVTTDTDISELSLAFDQLMRPTVAYIAAGTCKLYWYDSQAQGFVTTTFSGCTSPRLTLDDKRDVQNKIGDSDVLFVYIRAGGLYYRQQRDRFGVEYELKSPVSGSRIRRFGMADNLRLQIELEGGGNLRATVGTRVSPGIGKATEYDSAYPIDSVRAYAVAQVVENETAHSFTYILGSMIAQAEEIDVAWGFTVDLTPVLRQALETDTALPLDDSQVIAIGQSLETDTAHAVTAEQAADSRLSQGGVLLELDSNQRIANDLNATESLVWSSTAVWDPDGIWSPGSATATFTIPSGWTHIRVIGNLRWSNEGTGGGHEARVMINGSANPLYGGDGKRNVGSLSTPRQNLTSGIIPVSAGDTVEIEVTQNEDNSKDVLKDPETWMCVLRWEGTTYTHVERSTNLSIPYDTLMEVDFDNEVKDDLDGWDVGTPNRVVAPDGTKRYTFYAGTALEEMGGGAMFINLNEDGSSASAGPAFELEDGRSASQYTPRNDWSSAPILPAAGGESFALEVWHNSSNGSRDLLPGSYLQVEDANNSFGCVRRKANNQLISTVTKTVVTMDGSEMYSDDPGFLTGEADAIRIPAGTWKYALVYAGQPWGTTSANDRWMEIEYKPSGGSWGSWKGQAGIMARSSSLERSRFSMVGFIPNPSEGDEVRFTAWQNTGTTISILGGANSQYFAVELFE